MYMRQKAPKKNAVDVSKRKRGPVKGSAQRAVTERGINIWIILSDDWRQAGVECYKNQNCATWWKAVYYARMTMRNETCYNARVLMRMFSWNYDRLKDQWKSIIRVRAWLETRSRSTSRRVSKCYRRSATWSTEMHLYPKACRRRAKLRRRTHKPKTLNITAKMSFQQRTDIRIKCIYPREIDILNEKGRRTYWETRTKVFFHLLSNSKLPKLQFRLSLSVH